MRKVILIGMVIIILGAIILIASTWFHNAISEEYAQDNPLDNSGPCEGMSQDRAICSSLRTAQALITPGWFIIFVGSLVMTVGITLQMSTSRRPVIPLTKGAIESKSDLCPFCFLKWIPEDKDFHCNRLSVPVKEMI
ncbi:MAG: hypothetical protein JSV43_04595 [Methanobacteriota archaeon]|nr:MAG: hypothetical protein JSV43_04595 [Euryarchaeota archaeon]